MRSYDMKQTFNDVKSWDKKLYNLKTKYNKIQKIIEFINKTNKIDKREYFISETMNFISQEPENNFKGYKFNIITYIFLICLCENDEKNFFKSLINDKVSTEEEAEEWLKEIDITLLGFEKFYQDETNKNNWDDIYLNITNIFTNLTTLESNCTCIDYINKRSIGICRKIIALPDKEKKILYDNVLKSRFKYIDDKLEEIIKGMQEYNKIVYDSDLNLENNKNFENWT